MVLPCDVALLQGSCVLNEAMLTGESVPVVKYAVDMPLNQDVSERFYVFISSSVWLFCFRLCLFFHYVHLNTQAEVEIGIDGRCTLFAATKVLQLKPTIKGQNVLAYVVRTGYATQKGSHL